MGPIKIEEYTTTIYLTCFCGCRFSPSKRVSPVQYRGYLFPVSRYLCPGCKRVVTTTERYDGTVAKPAIVAGMLARGCRL